MFDVNILKGLSDSIGGWVDRFSRRGERIEEREKAGLQALCRALNETRKYLVRLERGKNEGLKSGGRDYDQEGQLSSLWTEAAPLLKRIDSNLARICLEKSYYWAEPEDWTIQEINEAGIGLKSVHEEAKKLLGS